MPAGYNPTQRRRTTLMKRAELFVAGARGSDLDADIIKAPKVHAFLDWPDGARMATETSRGAPYSPSYLDAPDDSWLQNPKAAGAGDVDGDGQEEAIVAYRRPAAGGVPAALVVKFLQYDPVDKDYVVLQERTVREYQSGEIDQYAWSGFWWQNFSVASGDADGNGKAETLVTFNGSAFTRGDADGGCALLEKKDYEPNSSAYRVLRAAAGDLDDDGRKKGLDLGNSGAYYPIVAAGDFDGDSTVVEFVESETLFSDPHPVAVLASNPFWRGVDMPGETSIGYLNATGEESESAIGFTTGFSIGYESDFAGIWKGSLKTSLESAFDATASEAVEISETLTRIGRNQDTVVFAAIPYDVYYYRVVRSPAAGAVGKTLTVNVPRTPIVRAVERGFYNANNGSGPDIEPATLGGSMVGDPTTYPTSAEADLLIAAGGGAPRCPAPPAQLTPGCAGGLKSASMELVGQGSVQTRIEMSIANQRGSGTEFDFEVKSEAEVGVGGWTAGVSIGFHYGESYKVYTKRETIFGGAVGGLPTDVAAQQFRWGLFSYQTRAGASPPFVVVQYYVEPVQ